MPEARTFGAEWKSASGENGVDITIPDAVAGNVELAFVYEGKELNVVMPYALATHLFNEFTRDAEGVTQEDRTLSLCKQVLSLGDVPDFKFSHTPAP